MRAPVRNLTLQRTIHSLRTDIKRALKRGNTLYDIADALKDGAIEIRVRTLELYLRRKPRHGAATDVDPCGEIKIDFEDTLVRP
jgi:hypothetical protein